MGCKATSHWLQELLGAFLSLSEVPEPSRAAAACSEAAAQAAAAAAPAGTPVRRRRGAQPIVAAMAAAQPGSAALLSHLSMLLPECPPETLQDISAAFA